MKFTRTNASAARRGERCRPGTFISRLQSLASRLVFRRHARAGIGRLASGRIAALRIFSRRSLLPRLRAMDRHRDAAVRQSGPLDFRRNPGLDGGSRRLALFLVFLGRSQSIEKKHRACLRACAFPVGRLGVRTYPFALHRFSLEPRGIRRYQKSRAAAKYHGHGNLRPFFSDRSLRLAVSVRHSGRYTARVADSRHHHGCADSRRAGRQLSRAQGNSALTAHLVQTNFPQSEHYPADWLQIHAGELDELARISIAAAKKNPAAARVRYLARSARAIQLARPCFCRSRCPHRARVGREFPRGRRGLEAGRATKLGGLQQRGAPGPLGRRIYTYDKIHLVPFGEYVPLRQWLTFAGRLTADISDFTPGTVYRVGEIPGGKFGTFICYEAIFPGEIRRFAASGAQLLIKISNDGWFGRSAAPIQHLMMSRVRAVESRRWLLRDTNNGFTAAIDPYGRIVAQLPTDIRGELDAPYDFQKRLHALCSFWRLVRVVLRDCHFGALVLALKPRRVNTVPELKRQKRMAEHIEDLQQRYAELKKRIELVRSFL